jgi:peptidoglycan/LPS O-acetylase OafA/YrhL
MRARRWVAAHRKSLAAAGLGLLQLAAYIVADPSKVPPWVVGLAFAVNAFGVWAAPANARPVTRADLAREVGPTRFRGRDDHI